MRYPVFKLEPERNKIESAIDRHIPYAINVTALDKIFDNTIFELNIFNENQELVDKKVVGNLNLRKGMTERLLFEWEPAKTGHYFLQAGTFGPNYTAAFLWEKNVMEFNVH